jgi:hypothetical protein
MRVNVVEPAGRFAAETRAVVVVDVARLRVEEVEHFDGNAQPFADFVAALEIDERRRLRPDRIVFDQWARTEVSKPHAAKGAAKAVDRRAKRDDLFERSGDVRPGPILVREATARERQIAVEHQPRP